MYVRYNYNNEAHEGFVDGDSIRHLNGTMFKHDGLGEAHTELASVDLLPPCKPSKVVCVGLNYRDHAMEMNETLPKSPLLFLKPSTSVIAHGDNIVAPKDAGRLDYEAELAIVIGKETKNIPTSDATQAIFGYTCANDFTARAIQLSDKQWTRGKSFDTFCPLGPGIVKRVNHDDARITLMVNGELRQESNINMFIFNVPEVVSYISRHMTLLPGDVILTGTPHGVGPVNHGDVMTVSIDGIGSLSNTLQIV
ncbi:fumarylacetoacetate hydrolase family protein [Halomonas sp. MCCC 1A11036]|uniref:Fumarylacetoacetate hydrolase family protein n=1 Tax=Billgrantia zhangzhouensis TaxID=2733481 RepID=A0ABS9ACX1_9GAMM|nr:fumarylacetoacetate hydrolase family protein [Halomonas zhangzhouensis]MCE8018763.1 fumarylacetoacetate hydrolase family protein [Halomonas zhangzhouensis]